MPHAYIHVTASHGPQRRYVPWSLVSSPPLTTGADYHERAWAATNTHNEGFYVLNGSARATPLVEWHTSPQWRPETTPCHHETPPEPMIMNRTPDPRRRSPLPSGAGAVRCTLCKAEARADGTGSPIVLRHAVGCPDGIPPQDVVPEAPAEVRDAGTLDWHTGVVIAQRVEQV